MGIKNEATATYAKPWTEVFQAAQSALPASTKMQVRQADPATGLIVLSRPMSAMSWGEDVQVQVWETAPGQAGVRVSSQLKFGLVDWGKNKKNIQAILQSIGSAVGAAPQIQQK